MRKKDKLYTANRFNQPLFQPDRERNNIFDGLTTGQSSQMNTSYKMPSWDQMYTQWRQDNGYFNSPVEKWNYNQQKYGTMFPTQQQQMQARMNNTTNIAGSLGSAAREKGTNLFSKEAWGKGGSGWATAGAVTGALGSIDTGDPRGMWDTADPFYHLAGGRESAAGNTMSDAGVALTQAGLSSGQPYLALAGGIVKVLGGLTNAAFGMKVDKAKLEAANKSMSSLRNFNGNASSFDAIKGPEATASVAGTYEGGWFTGGKARRKQKALEEAMKDARQFAGRSIANNVSNLAGNQINDALANYSAFGGPIETPPSVGGGALDYGLAMDYLNTKRQNAQNKNQMTNVFAGTPGSFFALGGDLQSNGADWTTGLTHINAGGSHEQNPNEGVQVGVDQENVPNLVEEGETIFDDYVYSTRILADAKTKQMFRLPKARKISYADISKKLEKEASERPNDPISQAGLRQQMHQLADQQERQKAEMEAQRAKEAFEALSPEEQTAVMQQVAQQEQAQQQQAMAEQAQMQQPSPEELAAAEQQEYNLGQEPQTFATGGGIVKGENGLIDYDKTNIELPEVIVKGKKRKPQTFDYASTPQAQKVLAALDEIDREQKQDELVDALQEELEQRKLDRQMYRRNRIHYYADGGLKERFYKAMGFNTDQQFYDWANKHKILNSALWGKDWRVDNKDEDFWKNMVIGDSRFKDAVKAHNPALADAINSGYDFGQFQAPATGSKVYDWDNFWEPTNEYSKQAGNAENKYRIDSSYKGKVKDLEASDDYKAFTDYILNNATDEERMNYFKWIDENTGRKNKYIINGKLTDNWKDMYTSARNDGLYGIQHYTPGMTEATRGAQAGNFVVNDDGSVEQWYGDVPQDFTTLGNYAWQDKDSDFSRNYYKRPVAAAVETHAEVEGSNGTEVDPKTGKVVPKHRAEWPRYAGLFGPAVGLGMMAAGIGKPDTASLDAAVEGAGDVRFADYKPLGNYLTYRPLDIWYEQNRLNANARATDRAILNSGVNQGSKMAGLLAAGYNDQIASGNLFRQAQEYNDALREKVASFNRGTDQFNSEQYGATSRFNAGAWNDANRAARQLRLQAAAQKMDADAGWYNSLYGNVAGLFKGLGDLGTENYRMNRISEMGADGIFGNLGESYTGKRTVKSKSEGGQAKRKKNKRRGLTF